MVGGVSLQEAVVGLAVPTPAAFKAVRPLPLARKSLNEKSCAPEVALMAKRRKKRRSKKLVRQHVWGDGDWSVKYGELKRGQGRPGAVSRLFQYIGEKIPFEALDDVRSHFRSDGTSPYGVYVAHDSMGSARYVGRGNVFSRLQTHKRAHGHELAYFSFFIVENKEHEREIETLLVRAAGPLLEFNERKKRVGIQPGNVRDFEPGTFFYERQKKKGKKRRTKRRPRA
jgi:hypothetical protein